MANIQGFGIQLATGGFSLEANTIFATYAEALAYAKSSAAYVGKVISVTSGDNKGVYSIESVGANAVLKEVGAKIDLSNYVTKGEISAVYKAKGSVATFEDLPTNAQVGDVYNVTATGKNYVWVENLVDGESGWDDLAGIVDLTPYATTASVNAQVESLNNAIAANTAGIGTLNAEVAKKVDAVEGSSLISADKLALIDTNAEAVGALNGQVSNLTGRVESLEQFFSDDSIEGGGLSLADVNAAITALQTDKADKGTVETLSGTVGQMQETLNAAVILNAEQTGYINSLQESVTELTNTYNSGIQGLTSTVNSHTEAIGKNATDLSALTAVVNTINGDYLKAADIAGKLDASVYEAKIAELVKADSDNLQAAKDYADSAASTAAGSVSTALAEEINRAKAAEQAVAEAVQAEAARIDALLTSEGVSEAVESFKELQEWIENHEGGAADILAAANNAQKEVDALELVVAGIDEAYKAADAATLAAAKEHVATELLKLGTAATKDIEYFASATALASVKATADAAAPQATTYTKDEVNANIGAAVSAAFAWIDVQ